MNLTGLLDCLSEDPGFVGVRDLAQAGAGSTVDVSAGDGGGGSLNSTTGAACNSAAALTSEIPTDRAAAKSEIM